MIVNIGHITINLTLTPVTLSSQDAAPAVTPVRKGHRTPEETQLKLDAIKPQIAIQERANKLQRRIRIAERLRELFGDEVANTIMGNAS